MRTLHNRGKLKKLNKFPSESIETQALIFHSDTVYCTNKEAPLETTE